MGLIFRVFISRSRWEKEDCHLLFAALHEVVGIDSRLNVLFKAEAIVLYGVHRDGIHKKEGIIIEEQLSLDVSPHFPKPRKREWRRTRLHFSFSIKEDLSYF